MGSTGSTGPRKIQLKNGPEGNFSELAGKEKRIQKRKKNFKEFFKMLRNHWQGPSKSNFLRSTNPIKYCLSNVRDSPNQSLNTHKVLAPVKNCPNFPIQLILFSFRLSNLD